MNEPEQSAKIQRLASNEARTTEPQNEKAATALESALQDAVGVAFVQLFCMDYVAGTRVDVDTLAGKDFQNGHVWTGLHGVPDGQPEGVAWGRPNRPQRIRWVCSLNKRRGVIHSAGFVGNGGGQKDGLIGVGGCGACHAQGRCCWVGARRRHDIGGASHKGYTERKRRSLHCCRNNIVRAKKVVSGLASVFQFGRITCEAPMRHTRIMGLAFTTQKMMN